MVRERQESRIDVQTGLHTVTVAGGSRIAYLEAGTRHRAYPPVVLVHGSLCDYRFWAPQIDALAAHRHVVAVSLPYYFPVTDQPAGTPFSIESHIDALLALFALRGWGPVALVGHSRGGCVAFHLARRNASTLTSLVLADPGGHTAESAADGKAAVAQALDAPVDVRQQAADLIAHGDLDGGLGMFVDAVSRPGFWTRSGPAFQAMARANAATLSLQIRHTLPLYTRADASGVTAPTLIINGNKSPDSFLATSETLAHWMPSASRVLIQGASHGMSLSHAQAFNRHLLDFLDA